MGAQCPGPAAGASVVTRTTSWGDTRRLLPQDWLCVLFPVGQHLLTLKEASPGFQGGWGRGAQVISPKPHPATSRGSHGGKQSGLRVGLVSLWSS